MEYSQLERDDHSLLVDALPLITLLISAADGFVDEDEVEDAKHVAEVRTFRHNDILNQFYVDAGKYYIERLDAYYRDMNRTDLDRVAFISEELSKLNPVLAKLNPSFSHLLYRDLLSFAKHVARSSGGVLSMGSISPEEEALMSLPMITPVEDLGI